MNWTVVWTTSSQNHLATVWMDAADQQAVTLAANAIDSILKQDPYSLSESRSDNTRIMVVPPLGVAFDVSDLDCLVTVWSVWRFE